MKALRVLIFSLCAAYLLSSESVYAQTTQTTSQLIWPLDNFSITRGFQYDPLNPKTERGTVRGHPAIDMTAGYGAPVRAAAEGVVIGKNETSCPNFVNPDCNYGAGNWIALAHPHLKLYTIYLHLKEAAKPSIGSFVTQGETIGSEGGSGRQLNVVTKIPVTNCCEGHLHFEVARKVRVYINYEGKLEYSIGEFIDPITILPKRDFK